VHVILDGYNVIRRVSRFADRERVGLEAGRLALLDALAAYGRATSHRLTVVFDGIDDGDVVENRTRDRGIEILYTARGSSADEALVRLARDSSRGAVVVVTADRQVGRGAERVGAAVVSPEAFDEKLALAARPAGTAEAAAPEPPRDEGTDDDPPPGGGTRKRGNPRRAPKTARRAAARLRRL
jgi:predicted RNA-binding protein with PIN domain